MAAGRGGGTSMRRAVGGWQRRCWLHLGSVTRPSMEVARPTHGAQPVEAVLGARVVASEEGGMQGPA